MLEIHIPRVLPGHVESDVWVCGPGIRVYTSCSGDSDEHLGVQTALCMTPEATSSLTFYV